MKRIVSLLLSLALFFSFSVTALAEFTDAQEDEMTTVVYQEDQTRAEETKWYYRIVDNSIVQKRLWSITYRKWLTDWITIGYVEPNL